ncbi:MAG: radical SAM protein [Solidesulfovibrio sp. DCME]|uniref:radical SAM protein n=1 Tax=Solidesulfovibrio sp. DCME TaxID=3447380 RepID=UPI003D0CB52F
MPKRKSRLEAARERSFEHHGRRISFHLPGMFLAGRTRGRYPAVSITGEACALSCDHCRGKLLAPMLKATSPQALVDKCRALEADGHLGVLVSGGCGPDGSLPWAAFLPALAEIKAATGLFVSVHSGFVDRETARGLKAAGVDQALVDVIGSDDTYREVYHLDNGLARLEASLAALAEAGLPVIPHIVCGLHYGALRGEARALDMVAAIDPPLVVLLSLANLPGTPMAAVAPPPPEAVAELLIAARLRLPRAEMSLGCARPRGVERLEILAVEAGVNRLALPSDAARQRAAELGLAVDYRRTCCSVRHGPTENPW